MFYKAVVFDLDGTLLDTLTDLADATNVALASFGFAEHPRESYKTFVGDGVETLIERVVPADRRDATTIAQCAAAMRKEYSQRWANTSRPYPGVPELLDGLSSRGVPMAILSNKPDEFTRQCVDSLLAGWRFATVLGAKPTLPKKPDPTGALKVAHQIDVPPAETVYLGDTNTDMRTAVAAGMFPVGAVWGFRPAEELTAAGARLLAAKPTDLLALFNQ